MPGAIVPPNLESIIDRIYGKGTKLQYGIPSNSFGVPNPVNMPVGYYSGPPTQWASIAGVTKISGPDKKRQGPVDCTELAPQTVFDGGDPGAGGTGIYPLDSEAGYTDIYRTAETYFFTHMAPGTKDSQPITASINTSKKLLFYLNYWFDNDVFLWFRILFTNGAGFRFFGHIAEIPVSIEDNKLVSVELSLQPFGRVVYSMNITTQANYSAQAPIPPGAF